MQRIRVLGLTAMTAACWAGAGIAADPTSTTAKPDDKPSFFARLNPWGKKDGPDAKAPSGPPVIVAPLPPAELADAVRAEQMAYLRRLEVCTRLRDVATNTKNEKLIDVAEELEKQAFAMYQARVARLGVKTGPRNAEAELDSKLGTGAGVNPLTVASPKPADDRSTTARRGGGRP
ncbi:MAG TPA: hypothetical protein VGJ05_13745 [Fimbriiglobus sp.]|jgi:hypothetical protein